MFRGFLGGMFRRGRGGKEVKKKKIIIECGPSERVERGATDVRDETGKLEKMKW